jgi:hypothetical protein
MPWFESAKCATSRGSELKDCDQPSVPRKRSTSARFPAPISAIECCDGQCIRRRGYDCLRHNGAVVQSALEQFVLGAQELHGLDALPARAIGPIAGEAAQISTPTQTCSLPLEWLQSPVPTKRSEQALPWKNSLLSLHCSRRQAHHREFVRVEE